MNQPSAPAIRKPRTDDRPLWDIVFGIWGYPAVLVAHDLKFSRCLPRNRAHSWRSVRHEASRLARPQRS
jgi:hypothetical protein